MVARLLLIAGLVGLAGCGGSSSPTANLPSIEFVVPKGFTGPVWVVLDPSAPDLLSADKGPRVTVPAGGLVRVQSIQALEKQHRLSARYDDGSPLPLGNEVGNDVVALRGGDPGAGKRGGRDSRYIAYFVGTEQQTEVFLTGDTAPKPGK